MSICKKRDHDNAAMICHLCYEDVVAENVNLRLGNAAQADSLRTAILQIGEVTRAHEAEKELCEKWMNRSDENEKAAIQFRKQLEESNRLYREMTDAAYAYTSSGTDADKWALMGLVQKAISNRPTDLSPKGEVCQNCLRNIRCDVHPPTFEKRNGEGRCPGCGCGWKSCECDSGKKCLCRCHTGKNYCNDCGCRHGTPA